MLIDGSATDRYYFAILLKRLEFKVLIAESGEEALEILQHHIPRLILTDIALPGMGSVEFIKRLTRSSELQNIPIIVLADRDDADMKATCSEMGCYACFPKRIEPNALYRSVQLALAPTPRAHIRINVPLKVVVGDGSSQGGAQRTEFTTSISEGGLYLRTLFPKPRDSHIPVKIFIRDRTVKAQTSVVYKRAMEGGFFREPGMGLKFIDMSQSDRNFVRHYIKDYLTSDIVLGI